MTMRSPIVAMLWENWRLTRIEAAQRLGLGIVAGSAALVLFDAGATVAFWILIAQHGLFYMSIAKLNGGRFMDGYKPGFPLHLLYTRPVPTVVFVGVAMAYDAFSCAALYLVSAALLGFSFGQPLPLLSVTMYIVVFHLVCTCIQWSTLNRVAQYLGSFVICLPFFFVLRSRAESTLRVEFSFAENALLVAIGLAAFGVAVAGVARQRSGGAASTIPQTLETTGFMEWLVSQFRLPCPTSSATRAQVWFELKSSGLPVLTIGLAFALMIPLLFAISIPVTGVRPYAIFAVMISVPAVVIVAGNAFGIRRKQGRAYMSAFDATLAFGTAQLTGLKMLVRTACVLAALIMVGVSAWTSSSLVNAWVPWVMDGKEATLGLLKWRREIREGIFGVQAIIAPISVALMVGSLATFMALRSRYPRHLIVGGSLLLLYGLALVLLVLATRSEVVSTFLMDALLRTTGWIVAAAMVFTTGYLFWSGFTERALTSRYVCGALMISVAFGVACLPAQSVASVLTTWLLPLMICIMAPWSLHRARHM